MSTDDEFGLERDVIQKLSDVIGRITLMPYLRATHRAPRAHDVATWRFRSSMTWFADDRDLYGDVYELHGEYVHCLFQALEEELPMAPWVALIP